MGDTVAPITTHPEADKLWLYAQIGELKAISDRMAIDNERQKEIRLAIHKKFFADAPEGTTTMPLEWGKALKINVPISRTVSDAQLEAVKKATLETIAKGEDVDAVVNAKVLLTVIDTIFRYKPEVSAGKWKDLDKETRLKLADVVTEKQGTPSIEIATPKR